MSPETYELLNLSHDFLNGLPDVIRSKPLTEEHAQTWNASVDQMALDDPEQWQGVQDTYRLNPGDIKALNQRYHYVPPSEEPPKNDDRDSWLYTGADHPSIPCWASDDSDFDRDFILFDGEEPEARKVHGRSYDCPPTKRVRFGEDTADGEDIIKSSNPDAAPIGESQNAVVSTRKAKIASFNAGEIYDDHRGIHRNWSAHGAKFRYTKSGALRGSLTSNELWTFILSRGNDHLMIIKIQKSPADASKRFMSGKGPRCLLAECPMARLPEYGMKQPNITVGDYMMAFDELSGREAAASHTYDPFAVSGYVHLYCAERFLGLMELCRDPNTNLEITIAPPIKADDKANLALNSHEAHVAQHYIEVLETGDGRPLNYPSYMDFSMPMGAHDNSLTQALHQQKWKNYTKAMQDRLAGRGNEGTMSHVHKGDLEVVYATKMINADFAHELKYGHRPLLMAAR